MKLVDLKQKWWYRTIQVIFVLVLIGCILSAIESTWLKSKSLILDKQGTTLICLSGNKNIHLLSDFPTLDISKDDLIIGTFSTKIDKKYDIYISDEICQLEKHPEDKDSLFKDFFQYAEDLEYEINPKYEKKYTNNELVIELLLNIIAITIFFEIVRRAFYYILSGKFIIKK